MFLTSLLTIGLPFVTDDPMRYSKPDNYVLLDKICHGSSYGLTKWYGLYPFGKVFCSHKDPYVPTQGGLTGPTESSPQVWKGHGVTMLCKFCR